jgi:hypothetical protein
MVEAEDMQRNLNLSLKLVSAGLKVWACRVRFLTERPTGLLVCSN